MSIDFLKQKEITLVKTVGLFLAAGILVFGFGRAVAFFAAQKRLSLTAAELAANLRFLQSGARGALSFAKGDEHVCGVGLYVQDKKRYRLYYNAVSEIDFRDDPQVCATMQLQTYNSLYSQEIRKVTLPNELEFVFEGKNFDSLFFPAFKEEASLFSLSGKSEIDYVIRNKANNFQKIIQANKFGLINEQQ